LDILGLWEEWQNWKQILISINEKTAREFGAKPYKIWDFSGYNSITTEELPAFDDLDAKMNNYIDSSHFRPEVGKKMLKTMLSKNIKNDFGSIINSKNIKLHLFNENNAKKSWIEQHKKTDFLELYIIHKDKRNKALVNDPFLDISQ
jgi:hypothetical protein